MATYTHATSGVKVTVSDDKELGPDWVPGDDETQKTRTPRKKADDKSDKS